MMMNDQKQDEEGKKENKEKIKTVRK